MRGRQLGFLGTLCVTWIVARVGFLSLFPADISSARFPEQAPTAKMRQSGQTALSSVAASTHVVVSPKRFSLAKNTEHSVIWGGLYAGSIASENIASIVEADTVPLHPQVATSIRLIAPVAPPPFRQSQSPLNIYTYSFFRQGVGRSPLAGAGQYGGSQTGFVATFRLGADTPSAWSMLARGAIAHDRLAERELAAGLRWQPLRTVPLMLTAERRFRQARPDAFAIYVAGGKSQVALPLKFRLDAFAQAGVVSGRDGGPFFDISTRADRKLVSIGTAPVTIGGGIWGGGQEGIFRVDAGPTIGTEIPIGTTRLRVNADWRFRIAGDAAPASGPALTLSTSF